MTEKEAEDVNYRMAVVSGLLIVSFLLFWIAFIK